MALLSQVLNYDTGLDEEEEKYIREDYAYDDDFGPQATSITNISSVVRKNTSISKLSGRGDLSYSEFETKSSSKRR